MSLVTSDVRSLTAEQIRGLASDQATLRTAVELARDDGWGPHGRAADPADPETHTLLWAVFPEPRRDDHRATVTLPDLRAACTCSATRFPCRHIIALLLRHHDGRLPDAAPPDTFAPPPHDDPDPGDAADRLPALIAGMADLRVWLGDLARRGMAGLPTARRDYWLAAADRLVDAYAFEAARELRDCAALPAGGADWPERLLPRLGRLALLCEAFARYDALTPAERGDALIAAGCPPAPAGPPVIDHWLVAGHHFEIDGRQRRDRVWLYGAAAGRWALLARTAESGQQSGLCLPPGAAVSGALRYRPGAHPLQAAPERELRLAPPSEDDPTAAAAIGIAALFRAYSAALAANPFQREFPAALSGVFVVPPSGDVWRIRDRAGHTVPLHGRFTHGWQLLALAADRPQTLFGEWDGRAFLPLSVLDGHGWRAMAGWRGVT